MRTKWDVLTERRLEAMKAYQDLDNQLKELERAQCNLRCSGCDELLKTEADFAKHFLIPDERYLNLGDCPNNPRKRNVR